MNEKYYDDILRIITERGPTGVNVLAKELNVPLSSMQRYLEKQSYFKKTEDRKWDLPNNVEADIKTNTVALMVGSVENALMLLDSQLAEIQLNVQNALMPVNTLKRAVNTIVAPVADKPTNLHPSVQKLLKFETLMRKALKDNKDNIPEEYIDVLNNVDYVEMAAEMGLDYVLGPQFQDITELITRTGDKLSEDTLEILEKYQKRT
jgi:hypothetical protein